MRTRLLLLSCLFFILVCYSQNEFITKWRTTTNYESITLPVNNSLSYDYSVDWGDGTVENNITTAKTHTYNDPGDYLVKIQGTYPEIKISSSVSKDKIIEVTQWGEIQWTSMYRAFQNCKNLQITASDIPDLTNCINLSEMFKGCTAFNSDINNWNVSNIISMNSIFEFATSFNKPLNNWNVSNVTSMEKLFFGASSFNQPLNDWNVSKVTRMSSMLRATAFNHPLDKWDVSSVIYMDGLFGGSSFNYPINNWDVSKVEYMNSMFSQTPFNQALDNWNTSSVKNMSNMFNGNTVLNQNLNSWNVTRVEDMRQMFQGATSFNGAIGNWVTTSLTTTKQMFYNASNFNQPIGGWNLSKVTDMNQMFYRASSFNQPIENWDVSNVTDMGLLFFRASSFNQPLNNWDVGKITSLSSIFRDATKFNQSLGNWNIQNVWSAYNVFDNSSMSARNYDKTIIGWSKLASLKSDVVFGADQLKYCNSETERTKIINDFSWRIFDAGKDCSTIDTPTTTNGMWNDPSNWASGVVPTSTDNVVIPTGTTLQVSADISEINSLENEGTIVISPTYSLKSKSNMVNTGTIIMDSSTDDSSVLFIEGTSSGNVTYTRGGLKANKWSLVTPPVSGQKIKEFATDSSNDIRINTTVNPNRYAIGYYSDAATEGDKWVYYTANIDENSTFTAGQSYALSRATDGSVSFTGTLTTNNLTRTLQPGEWNAIGNPFTTYYPANKNGASSFINDNYDILDDNYKGIYVWDNSQNKYVAVSEADIQNRALTPGQGFFIKLKAGENEIEFKQDKRSIKPTTGNNVFNKNDNSYIQLFASNGEYKIATNINFLDNATSGFDVGLDIGNFSSSSFDFYSKLVDKSNNKNYTTQSLANENKDDIIIPLELAVKNSKVTFSSKSVNLKENVKLYLEDRLKNTFTDITNETDSYKISFDENNIIKERFYLHVKSEVLNLDNSLINQIQVFSSNKTLHIRGIKDQIKVEVFNLLGKSVYAKSFKNINTIDIPLSVSDGVYLVKVIVDNKSIVKKTVMR